LAPRSLVLFFQPDFRRVSVAAFREFKADMDSGSYPEARRLIEIDEREYTALLRTLEERVVVAEAAEDAE